MGRTLLDYLLRYVSKRFIKFCLVGATGVGVNAGCLALLTVLGVHQNLAAAFAIELSLVGNFLLNNAWTFGSTDAEAGVWSRLVQYHVVCAGGAAVQLIVFAFANVVWFALLWPDSMVDAYFAAGGAAAYVWAPIKTPPDVGLWAYVSLLMGVGVATIWNYKANVRWTWKPANPATLASTPTGHQIQRPQTQGAKEL